MQADLLVNCNCILGEGPLWHAKRKTIFWVDIEGKCFYEYNQHSGKLKQWQLDKRVSVIIETNEVDVVLLGVQGALIKFDLNTSEQFFCTNIENEITNNRTNDGKCDSEGRLWIGTMDVDLKDFCGSLYVIDNNFQLHKKLPSLSISNGIAWSDDNSIMYFIDTPTQKINAFDFDAATGNIIFRKMVVEIPLIMGSPDGMCIDTEGMLWVAHWGGNGVYRWNPGNGELVDKIEVPCPHVTSCCFGGDNFETLFITTAKQGLSEDQLRLYPNSGGLFAVKPGVKGLASNCFGQ